jgi:hypothetical protein
MTGGIQQNIPIKPIDKQMVKRIIFIRLKTTQGHVEMPLVLTFS